MVKPLHVNNTSNSKSQLHATLWCMSRSRAFPRIPTRRSPNGRYVWCCWSFSCLLSRFTGYQQRRLTAKSRLIVCCRKCRLWQQCVTSTRSVNHFIYPRNDLSYAENFLHMMFANPCEEYEVNPVVARAMDKIFTFHADHEQNASTSTVRLAGSSGAKPIRMYCRRYRITMGTCTRRCKRSVSEDAGRDW